MSKVLMTISKYVLLKKTTRMTVYRQIRSGKIEAYRSPDNKRWLLLVSEIV